MRDGGTARRRRLSMIGLTLSGALLIVVAVANLLEDPASGTLAPPRPLILELLDTFGPAAGLVGGAVALAVGVAGLAGRSWVWDGPQLESPAKERLLLGALAAMQAAVAFITARQIAVQADTRFWRALPVTSLPFVDQATLPLVEGILLLVALLGLVATAGLALGRAWGWYAGLFAGGAGLVNIPVGSLIGAFLLYALHRERSGFLAEGGDPEPG